MKIISSLFLFLIFSYGAVPAQEPGQRAYFENKTYHGGLNIASDSASIAPDEALVMDNLRFNKWGSLEKRPAWSYWNYTQFPGTSEIVNDIKRYTPLGGTAKQLIATQYYIYAHDNYTDIDSIKSGITYRTSDWKSHRIGYHSGMMYMKSGSNIAHGVNTWWITGVKKGDTLSFRDSVFAIDSIITDTSLVLSHASYWGDTTISSYNIWRYIPNGNTDIATWNKWAYFACDKVSPFYYDGDNVRWLAWIDTGTVDSTRHSSAQDTIDIADGVLYVYYRLRVNNNGETYKCLIDHVGISNTILADSLDDLINAGRVVRIKHLWTSVPGETPHASVTRFITGEDSTFMGSLRWFDATGRCGTAGYPYIDPVENPKGALVYVGYSPTDTFSITDKSNSFNELYRDYYIIFGNRPWPPYKIGAVGRDMIQPTKIAGYYYGNSDSMMYNTVKSGHYYIFSTIPAELGKFGGYDEHETSPVFKQIEFYRNILFAFGYQLDSNRTDTINQDLVYHSDIELPKMTKTLAEDGITQYQCRFNLSLNQNDIVTSMFNLHDRLVISSKSRMYAQIGYPQSIGDGYCINILPNFGLPNNNSFLTRDNNYAYLANPDGLFLFDGNSVNKISSEVEPLVRKYNSSRCKISYLNDNVYFGFIDSGYTLVYYEPTKKFTRNLFGISAVDNQLNDSSFFLFSSSGIDGRRVFKFPVEGQYVDSSSSSARSAISVRYKTGWLPMGDIMNKKVFERFYSVLTKSTDTLVAKYRSDFDTLPVVTDSIFESACSTCGQRLIYIRKFNIPFKGRYFQWELVSNSYTYFSLGAWGLKWYYSSEY